MMSQEHVELASLGWIRQFYHLWHDKALTLILKWFIFNEFLISGLSLVLVDVKSIREPTHMCVTWSTVFMINSNCVGFLFCYFPFRVQFAHSPHTPMGFFQVLIWSRCCSRFAGDFLPSQSFTWEKLTQQSKFVLKNVAEEGLNWDWMKRMCPVCLSSSRQSDRAAFPFRCLQSSYCFHQAVHF